MVATSTRAIGLITALVLSAALALALMLASSVSSSGQGAFIYRGSPVQHISAAGARGAIYGD